MPDPLPPLPVFWSRADGLDGNLGTANADGQLIIQGPNGATDYVLQESVDSPRFERAEQGTVTKKFTDIPYVDSCTYMAGLARGTIQVDNSRPDLGAPFIFRILSSEQQMQSGNKATISIVSESLSFDTPPDEFQVVPIELGIDILRHPRYRLALDPTITDESNTVPVSGDGEFQVSISTVKQAIIRAIQTYRDSAVFPSADNLNGLFQNNVVTNFNQNTVSVLFPSPIYDPSAPVADPTQVPPPVIWDGTAANEPTDPTVRYWIVNVDVTDPGIQFALAAAKEIIQKIWRMEDTPLLTGFEVTWSAYYPRPPILNPGSYIENPMTEANPALPDYFWATPGSIEWTPPREGSPTPQGPNGEASIFDSMADINPQCYADDDGLTSISWLRKADEFEFNRCWFRVTRKWLGAPIGNWDLDLYNTTPRPNLTTYLNNPPGGYRKLTV